MSVYAVRLQEDKTAVGLMYAGSQRQLFEEKEEAKAIEENEDSEKCVHTISDEREEELWKRATVNIDDYAMQIAYTDDDDSDWENFDDYDWLEDIRECAKQIEENV